MAAPNCLPLTANRLNLLRGKKLGHAFGTGDEGPGNLDNVNENENPIMEALGEQFKRSKYDGASNKGWKTECQKIPTTK